MDDNLSDALKMAAAFLMFIVALSIAMSSFSKARLTVQYILEMNDREYDYTYVNNLNTTKRIVGAETIIPTVYRAYKENYKIFFMDNSGNPMTLYKRRDENGNEIDINYIDLEKETIASDKMKEAFINAILYGDAAIDSTNRQFFNSSGIKFFTKGEMYVKIILCSVLQSNKFEETLGEYYQEDLVDNIPGGGVSTSEQVPESNKTKKRVITYKMII